MRTAWLAMGLLACGGGPNDASECACPADVDGYVFAAESRCLCMPLGVPTEDPPPTATFDIEDEEEIDWPAVDAALIEGHVLIRYSGERRRKIEVLRTDDGPHRLILDGQGQSVIDGVTTGQEDVPRHRVTVRGFEMTRGSAQGVYWRAGDGVLIEDNQIHHVRGSPAINLEYANRSGIASDGFTVRNNHVYEQDGECIYIGGSEGEDLDAHTNVRIEHNLVHDCSNAFDSKHDAINVKDRMTGVVVYRNVVARTDWGIEVASAGRYDENVSMQTDRQGFHVVDAFQAFRDMSFTNNVVYDAGRHGFQLITENPTDGMVIDGLHIAGARQAGFLLGGAEAPELTLRNVTVEDADVALDGWGDPARTTVEGCTSIDNKLATDRAFEDTACAGTTRRLPEPAGPDGVFFTADDR